MTVTVGSPDTWDYEIAQQVAKSCSVANEAIDLRGFEWSSEKLISHVDGRVANAGDLFESTLFREIYTVGVGSYWLGRLADTLAGSHLRWRRFVRDPDSTSGATQAFFLAHASQSLGATASTVAPAWAAASGGIRLAPTIHPLDELDLAYRQQHLYTVLSTQHAMVMPFADKYYSSFFLHLPDDQRRNKKLYCQMFAEKFPNLARMPSKDFMLGLTRNRFSNSASRLARDLQSRLPKELARMGAIGTRPNKKINYVDWNREYALNESLRETLRELESRASRSWGAYIPRDLRERAKHAMDLQLRVATLGTLSLE